MLQEGVSHPPPAPLPWPALPPPRCCDQHSQTTLCTRRGGTHFRTAKSQGWLSPRAVLHHGCMKNPAGSARVGMGIKPFVWSYFIPNTGESRGCRSRGKCFMIAVSKCSSNQLQLACKHSQEGPVQPGNSWGHTHTNAFVEFAVFEIIEN